MITQTLINIANNISYSNNFSTSIVNKISKADKNNLFNILND
jgi:hypothetical protein